MSATEAAIAVARTYFFGSNSICHFPTSGISPQKLRPVGRPAWRLVIIFLSCLVGDANGTSPLGCRHIRRGFSRSPWLPLVSARNRPCLIELTALPEMMKGCFRGRACSRPQGPRPHHDAVYQGEWPSPPFAQANASSSPCRRTEHCGTVLASTFANLLGFRWL